MFSNTAPCRKETNMGVESIMTCKMQNWLDMTSHGNLLLLNGAYYSIIHLTNEWLGKTWSIHKSSDAAFAPRSTVPQLLLHRTFDPKYIEQKKKKRRSWHHCCSKWANFLRIAHNLQNINFYFWYMTVIIDFYQCIPVPILQITLYLIIAI